MGHVHISDIKRTKLDDKNVKYVFLGYNGESKAFKMYDPVEKRIHISRDVIFEEDKKWIWKENHSNEQDFELEWENEQNEEINEEDENDAEAEAAEVENVEVNAQSQVVQPQSRVGETRVRKPPI